MEKKVSDLNNKDKGEFTIVDPDDNSFELHVSDVGGGFVHIVDSVNVANKASVTGSGELKVIQSTSTPPATTAVDEGEVVLVTKNGGTDSYNWTIPSGETFTLQTFNAGGYYPSSTINNLNAKISLYYRPGGAGVIAGEVLVGTIYLNSISMFALYYSDNTYSGDGTAVMEMEATNWANTNAELSYYIRGYY